MYLFVFFACVFDSSDDPMPRLNSQVQVAEDILDKYRNIKRTSPSDGATAGAIYEGAWARINRILHLQESSNHHNPPPKKREKKAEFCHIPALKPNDSRYTFTI